MKKLLVIMICLVVSGSVYGAGDGSVGDPWDSEASLNSAWGSTTSCGNTYYLEGNTVASPTAYTSEINLDQACTSGNRIVLSVSNGTIEVLGGAVFNTQEINVSGDYTTVRGFQLTGTTRIDIMTDTDYTIVEYVEGYASTLANAQIDCSGHNATYTEVRYSSFHDSTGRYIIRARNDTITNNKNAPYWIHHCAFFDLAQGSNKEIIQVGDGAQSAFYGYEDDTIPYMIKVEYCYFHNNNDYDGSGVEMVSFKVSKGIFRYNWVEDNDSHFTLRIGHNSQIYSNHIFTYEPDPPKLASNGMRVYGSGQKIYNNYIEIDSSLEIGGYGIRIGDGDKWETGTVSSLSGSTITVDGASWETNEWANYALWLKEGTLEKAYTHDAYHIASNTATVITMEDDVDINFSTGGGQTYHLFQSGFAVTDSLIANNTIHNSGKAENLRLSQGKYDDEFAVDSTYQNNLFLTAGAYQSSYGFYEYQDVADATTFLDNIVHVSGSASAWYSTPSNAKPSEVYTGSECTWVSGDSCDPGFTASTYSYIPQAGYSAENAGTAHADVTVDIYGNTRSDPPTAGAFELGGSVPGSEAVGCGYDGCGSNVVPSQVTAANGKTLEIGGGSQAIAIGGGSQTMTFN